MRPPKGEALTGGTVQGLKSQTETDKRDFTSARAGCKAFATIRAELALKGYGLAEHAGGALLITRWDLRREVHSLDAAARFLHQIGGAA